MSSALPRSLEHPLPAGLRDLLPDEAALQRALSVTLLERFARFGFRLVTPPAFELADVIERGLGTLSASDVIRFIEPESGEVAVLRPDLTPQIARIVATRLVDHPPPHRLAYEGTVVRRRIGRAKKHRQIPQVGVELCGVAEASADLELLELAADALRASGLVSFRLDLSDAGIVRALLADVPPERAEAITDALAKKDDAQLAEHAGGLAVADTLRALARLHGDRRALVEATALLAATPAASAAQRLLALFDAASARGLGEVLSADPGDVRGLAYYTGSVFTIYAPGPGEPIGGGGRYDDLLARFGTSMPAVGLALDLDALGRARKHAGVGALPREGVVVVGADGDERVTLLRARGVPAVAIAREAEALPYARSWNWALVWTEHGALLDGASGAPRGQVDSGDESGDDVLRVLKGVPRGA